MATDLATLRVNVVAATRDFERGMGRVRKDTQSATKSFATMRSQVLGVAAAAAGIGFLAKKTFDVGAAVEETASKYRTVFGPAVEETNKLLGRQARVMGLTDQQAQELVATTGAIVQGMGLAKRESAEFSVEITKLAADFASFNNVPIADTSRAIQAALTGERESLKRLGVVILETDVQKRALLQTGKENAKQLTQQEKAYATLSLVTERAGVAVGDLSRTQDSAANVYRRVAATIRQLRDDIATGLLPAMSVILGVVDDGTDGLAQWGQAFRENGMMIAAWATLAITAAKAVSVGFKNLIQILFNLGAIIGTLATATLSTLSEKMDIVRGIMADTLDLAIEYGEAFRDIGTAWGDLRDTMSGGLSGSIGSVDDGLVLDLKTMTAGLNEVERSIKSVATAFQDSLVDAITGAEDAFKNFVVFALREMTKLLIKFAIFKGLTAAATGGSSGAADLLKILGMNFGGAVDGALAHGGPAKGGKTYLVGEQGPELFTPQQSGYVHANGSGVNIDFSTFPAPSNPLAMARDAEWMRFLTESLENARSGGYSFQGAG